MGTARALKSFALSYEESLIHLNLYSACFFITCKVSAAKFNFAR